MLELMMIPALVAGVLLVLVAIAAVSFTLKIFFKLLLLPFWVLGVVLKGILALGALLVVLALAPIILIAVLLILPIAAFAGLVGFGAWALT